MPVNLTLPPFQIEDRNNQTILNSPNQTGYYPHLFDIDQASLRVILNVTCVFSGLTTVSNIMVLLASKFTTAGKSATLVFIRSLCIADTLVGIFGIFKTLLLNNMEGLLINCFLPESLFISASTTLALSIFWLNVDSYLRLTKPLGYARSMDKSSVITVMTIVWNLAFIIGFLPQMGWSSQKHVCKFFNFYTTPYLLLVSVLWILCILGSCAYQYALYHITKSIRLNGNFISPQSIEFKKYSHLIVTIRIDIVIWALCYMPLLLYLVLHCPQCVLGGSETANNNLAIFLPVFLLRSFLCAFVHSYRTVQIQQVMKKVPRRMSKILRKTVSISSGEENTTTLEMISGATAALPNGNGHSKATRLTPQHRLNTLSNMTLFTTIDEASVSDEITSF